jgi:hypothetical protein
MEELLRQILLEQKATNKLLNDLIQLFLKYDTDYATQMEKEYGHLQG